MTKSLEKDGKYFVKDSTRATDEHEETEGYGLPERSEQQTVSSFKIDDEKYKKVEAKVRKVGHVAEQDS